MAFLATLLLSLVAAAAPSSSRCRIEAVFLAPETALETSYVKKEYRERKKVYWHLKAHARSSKDPAVCPQGEDLRLRVRGAVWNSLEKGPEYPIHIIQPKRGQGVVVEAELRSGVTYFTELKFSEWTLYRPDPFAPGR